MYNIQQQEKKIKENKKAVMQLLSKSNNQKVIKQLPTLHEYAFEKVDCLQCANCCKKYSPRFKAPDIKRISKHLRMKDSELMESFLILDSDGDFVLQKTPCPFLEEDNTCKIYEVRPRDCQRYPYTDEDVFVKQPQLTVKNTSVCPAAFEVLLYLDKGNTIV